MIPSRKFLFLKDVKVTFPGWDNDKTYGKLNKVNKLKIFIVVIFCCKNRCGGIRREGKNTRILRTKFFFFLKVYSSLIAKNKY